MPTALAPPFSFYLFPWIVVGRRGYCRPYRCNFERATSQQHIPMIPVAAESCHNPMGGAGLTNHVHPPFLTGSTVQLCSAGILSKCLLRREGSPTSTSCYALAPIPGRLGCRSRAQYLRRAIDALTPSPTSIPTPIEGCQGERDLRRSPCKKGSKQPDYDDKLQVRIPI